MIQQSLQHLLTQHGGSVDAPPSDWKNFLNSVNQLCSNNEPPSSNPTDTTQQDSPMNPNTQHNTEYLTSVLNTIADPLFVKNRKHEWVLVNDAFCTVMGHKKEELLNKSDYEFLPKEQADVFWAKDEEVFTTKKETVNEETLTDHEGKVHTIVTKKTLFKDSSDQEFIVGIIRDISDRVDAERALQVSEQQLSLFMKNNPALTWIKNANGQYQYVNKAFETVLQLKSSDVLGKTSADLFSKELATNLVAHDQEVLQNHTSVETDETVPFPDHTMHTIHVFKFPAINAAGEIIICGVGIDVTSERTSALALKARSDELEILNKTMVGRELKMMELKQEIEQLRETITTSHAHTA